MPNNSAAHFCAVYCKTRQEKVWRHFARKCRQWKKRTVYEKGNRNFGAAGRNGLQLCSCSKQTGLRVAGVSVGLLLLVNLRADGIRKALAVVHCEDLFVSLRLLMQMLN
jgi:hypothetical protein